jgi:hypothetical protein
LTFEATCIADSWALLKILLFLSFHRFHNVKITIPLNRFLSPLVILVSASSHHEIKCTGSYDGRINWALKCSQDRMRLHIALANGQSSDKCSPVSSGALHKTQ